MVEHVWETIRTQRTRNMLVYHVKCNVCGEYFSYSVPATKEQPNGEDVQVLAQLAPARVAQTD
jgi:hypothetical protein